MKKIILVLILIICFIPFYALDFQNIKLPENFQIELYAKNVKGSRTLDYAKPGIIFVGTRIGKVYALIDNNNDYKADKIITIANNLNQPNGIEFYNGNIYRNI